MIGVRVTPSALKQTHWWEYLVRFGFGGAIAVATGVIGHFFGPLVAGLFLAFPAILPASLTLVAVHDGKKQAADDAAGAACGAIGLLPFAAIVWAGAGRAPMALVLALALVAWLVVSVLAWMVLSAGERRHAS
ncbi:MAG TPA: DUF3147 family protein [Polyangia bacterium]|jgi:hypothetical protein